MNFSGILEVLLLTLGAVIGTVGYSYLKPKIPYGTYILAIVGLGIALYSSRIDGRLVGEFVKGFGIGFILPLVAALIPTSSSTTTSSGS